MNQGNSAPADPRRVVLASSSIYRRALLERLCVPFDWRAPDIDETVGEFESPDAAVRRLGAVKARTVARFFPRALVIGGDQVAMRDGVIVGKPHTKGVASEQLARASGREVTFLSSVAAFDSGTGSMLSEVVPVTVRFRTLSEQEIDRYLDAERPFDCAGSFKCEGLGIALFEEILSTDPTALTGLPLIALNRLLRRHGFDVLAAVSAQRGRSVQ